MSTALDPRLVFERLTVGPGNGVAVAAARSVAESPGRSYNPLVIAGPAGLAKTHLLHAIGHLAAAVDPELRVHFETAEGLVDRLTESIAAGTVEDLRAALGRADLLLLDDLEQVAGKGRTEEELTRLCDALVARGAQVVVAARKPPQEIARLDPKLAERLAGGLTVEVVPDEPLGASAAEPSTGDEFGAFLADISTAVAAVVETSPWRRRLADAILRWEGEGIRTRRLEQALDADSAPDVDALLADFSRDARRLGEIARELSAPPTDPALLTDPDRLTEAEALLAAQRGPGAEEPEAPLPTLRPAHPPTDPWFLDRERFCWRWTALDERLLEERK